MTATVTIYDQIGGAAAVDAAVDIFYRKVLKDARIKKFFKGVDMNQQIAKQKAFLTMVFGGPVAYTGKDMRAAHARLVQMADHDLAINEVLGATEGDETDLDHGKGRKGLNGLSF